MRCGRPFHSPAVKLDRLTALWTQLALRLFPQILRVNGRCVLVGDGIKVAKCGRKVPGVKLLHQQSRSIAKIDQRQRPRHCGGHDGDVAPRQPSRKRVLASYGVSRRRR